MTRTSSSTVIAIGSRDDFLHFGSIAELSDHPHALRAGVDWYDMTGRPVPHEHLSAPILATRPPAIPDEPAPALTPEELALRLRSIARTIAAGLERPELAAYQPALPVLRDLPEDLPGIVRALTSPPPRLTGPGMILAAVVDTDPIHSAGFFHNLWHAWWD